MRYVDHKMNKIQSKAKQIYYMKNYIKRINVMSRITWKSKSMFGLICFVNSISCLNVLQLFSMLLHVFFLSVSLSLLSHYYCNSLFFVKIKLCVKSTNRICSHNLNWFQNIFHYFCTFYLINCFVFHVQTFIRKNTDFSFRRLWN